MATATAISDTTKSTNQNGYDAITRNTSPTKEPALLTIQYLTLTLLSITATMTVSTNTALFHTLAIVAPIQGAPPE